MLIWNCKLILCCSCSTWSPKITRPEWLVTWPFLFRSLALSLSPLVGLIYLNEIEWNIGKPIYDLLWIARFCVFVCVILYIEFIIFNSYIFVAVNIAVRYKWVAASLNIFIICVLYNTNDKYKSESVYHEHVRNVYFAFAHLFLLCQLY